MFQIEEENACEEGLVLLPLICMVSLYGGYLFECWHCTTRLVLVSWLHPKCRREGKETSRLVNDTNLNAPLTLVPNYFATFFPCLSCLLSPLISLRQTFYVVVAFFRGNVLVLVPYVLFSGEFVSSLVSIMLSRASCKEEKYLIKLYCHCTSLLLPPLLFFFKRPSRQVEKAAVRLQEEGRP